MLRKCPAKIFIYWKLSPIHSHTFQDLLMVIYLTQLTKTQLQLHEKLTAVSVNQLKDYQKLIPE